MLHNAILKFFFFFFSRSFSSLLVLRLCASFFLESQFVEESRWRVRTRFLGRCTRWRTVVRNVNAVSNGFISQLAVAFFYTIALHRISLCSVFSLLLLLIFFSLPTFLLFLRGFDRSNRNGKKKKKRVSEIDEMK